MKTLFFAALLFAATVANAQVGVGTDTPNPNSVLDVSSSDKGMLLPRISDTANVSNPSEGLVIYNMKTKTPAFHDGARWNMVASAKSLTTDSVTYTISNASAGGLFINGTFALSSFNTGISSASVTGTNKASFQEVTITKMLDSNSIAFTKSAISSPNNSNMVIEFTSYTPGNSAPNYSIKLTSPAIHTYQVAVSSDGNLYESITMSGIIYGYKNWKTHISYAWNIPNNSQAPY